MPRDATLDRLGKPKTRAKAESVDVAYLVDLADLPRYACALADEISVQAAAGYSTLVVALDPPLDLEADVPEWLRHAVDVGQARLAWPAWDQPVRAKLAMIPNPERLIRPVEPSARISAERCLLLLERDPIASDGSLAFDLQAAQDAAWALTDCRPDWASSWPGMDAALRARAKVFRVLPEPWTPVVDPDRWSAEPPVHLGEYPVAGRFAEAQGSQWPMDLRLFLSRYALSRHLRLRFLGLPLEILRALRRVPANWDVFPRKGFPPERFLRGLDFFIHYPGPRLLDLPQHSILAAFQAGRVALLPRQLEPYFGDAALYPSDGRDAIDSMVELHRNRDAYGLQAAKGRSFVESHHAPRLHLERLHRLIGRPLHRPRAVALPPAKHPSKTVLFVTSNGVGMGHLTRLLAIARRMPPGVTPVFATMSQALAVVRAAGYHAEYLPFHTYIECDKADWNAWLKEELGRLIALFDAKALIYDGGSPHQGVIDAAARKQDVALVWCRRAMWQDPLWDEPLSSAKFFDLVIEPGELAGAYDRGSSLRQRDRVAAVDPILLLDEDELLSRAASRKALGLDPDRPATLIQLGAGNYSSQQPLVDEIAKYLGGPSGSQLVLAEWLMSERTLGLWPEIRRLRNFPNAKYLRAFDSAISAAGYNSFHEVTHYGVPTLFLPVELPFLDDQLGRASHAADEGYGLVHRATELRRLPETLAELMDPARQAGLREGCRLWRRPNGAAAAAEMIARLVNRNLQSAQEAPQGAGELPALPNPDVAQA